MMKTKMSLISVVSASVLLLGGVSVFAATNPDALQDVFSITAPADTEAAPAPSVEPTTSPAPDLVVAEAASTEANEAAAEATPSPDPTAAPTMDPTVSPAPEASADPSAAPSPSVAPAAGTNDHALVLNVQGKHFKLHILQHPSTSGKSLDILVKTAQGPAIHYRGADAVQYMTKLLGSTDLTQLQSDKTQLLQALAAQYKLDATQLRFQWSTEEDHEDEAAMEDDEASAMTSEATTGAAAATAVAPALQQPTKAGKTEHVSSSVQEFKDRDSSQAPGKSRSDSPAGKANGHSNDKHGRK